MSRQDPTVEFLGRAGARYSEGRLRHKLLRHALAAGREVVEKVLWLYYASRRPDVPYRAKATIYAALGYFILPFDAIPDLAPMIGYTDDLLVLGAALLTIAGYVDDEVKEKTRLRMQDWFGESP